MGGHDHGIGPLYKIPNPDIYKVEDVPRLKKVQDLLAERGLKDPWLRNEVWRFTTFRDPPVLRSLRVLLRGAILGIPAFLITIGIEHAYGITYKPDHEHDEGSDH